MTKEDIIKLAQEAGFNVEQGFLLRVTGIDEDLERFAALVAAAVAEPVQEPVAWANSFDLQNFDMKVRTCPDLHHTVPLYTAPPKKQWVGLTDEEWYAATGIPKNAQLPMPMLKGIEKALKEKNG